MGKFSALAAMAALSATLFSASAAANSRDPINAYRVHATAKNLEKLALAGFDVTEGRRGSTVEVYGTATQLRKLRGMGVSSTLVKDSKGRTTAARSARLARRGKARAAQAEYTGSDAAYKIWRRYDRVPGDGKEQYMELYDRLAGMSIVKKEVLGTTYLGREIVALKVTRNAKNRRDNTRPAVLYNALQHAREWLAGETCRRTLLYFTDNYAKDPQVTRLLDTRELWFVCVNNPDGYEYTFTPGNRLWRKNMRDNDNDGIRGENGDGVDPNRNFPVDWGLDNEGSSPVPASETYRGPEPYVPEPETQAMLDLFDKVDFKFEKNDHTAAQLLLYPQGWQQYTPATDDPIYTALAGDDAHPAIDTFDPDLGAELYITNGDTLDTAYNRKGILAYTPEGTAAKDPAVSGFEFEDNDGAIGNEFKRHKPFALDLAESADDPDEPDSHLGNTADNFYVDSFAESYGDPQVVQVLAKRSLGAIELNYRINGGATQQTTTSEWSGGERYYTEPGVYYHKVRGNVTGTSPGDSVEVWFSGGGERSKSFTYTATSETGNKVLIMSAEDYSGPTPAQDPSGPKYVDEYLAALAANGVAADVYDVDAHGRRAPHPLGVLGHYDAVIWDTGDDYLTREPGQVPGTGTSRLALDEQVAARDYINEGGKLMYAGKHAGQQYSEGFEFRNTGFPQPNESKFGSWCDASLPEARDGCIPHVNDFLQYYLGAYLRVDNGNSWTARDGSVYPLAGEGVFGPGPWTFANTAGDPGAGAPTATFGVTSSMIDRPAFQDSKRLAGWQRPGAGPFSPYTGDYFMASGQDDEAYKRLWTTVDLTGATSGNLGFRTSFDLEDGWDYVFVEARPVGTENWTTLPDANGHNAQSGGDSCWTDGGWNELHARLLHYQTPGRDTCSPTGTTGQWWAATGSSNGWQDWSIDLSRYTGQQVEIAIVVATDWASGNLGAWVDDATITVGGAQQSTTSFETDTGVWNVGPAPAGTPNPDPNWTRTRQQFAEGAVVGTDHTVYAGFEPATIATAAERASFMKEVMEHLGVPAS